jgi:hypothetical protein
MFPQKNMFVVNSAQALNVLNGFDAGRIRYELNLKTHDNDIQAK